MVPWKRRASEVRSSSRQFSYLDDRFLEDIRTLNDVFIRSSVCEPIAENQVPLLLSHILADDIEDDFGIGVFLRFAVVEETHEIQAAFAETLHGVLDVVFLERDFGIAYAPRSKNTSAITNRMGRTKLPYVSRTR